MKFITFLLAIQIMLASFLPNMDTQELSKFSELIDHYQLHKKTCNFQGNFFDFVSLHYGSKNNDGHDHRNLPFKNFSHAFDYFFSVPQFSIESLSVLSFSDLVQNSGYAPSFIASFFGSIWQPPQI